jgi:hypothetical protein
VRWAERRGHDPSGVFLAVKDSRGIWGLYARVDKTQPYPRALLLQVERQEVLEDLLVVDPLRPAL